MTQSGVSQHIKKLEEQLGTPLLLRDGKQFSLSDAGRKLYQEGQQILQALSNVAQHIGDDPAFEGTVRIMSPGSLGLKLYPHLLDLQVYHPQLSVEYRFAPNHDIENGVVSGDADLGFVTRPSDSPLLHCQPIAQEQLLLVTPASVAVPHWQDLCALGFIDHPDGDYHASLLLQPNYPQYKGSKTFTRKGFSNQIGLILEPVSRGLGFTVLPAYAVAAFDKSAQIRTHTLTTPVSETIYYCCRRGEALPRRLTTVLDEARKWL
ncbi:LysR family transcriptional regulator [Alteromonas halophila]|uniref:LysR family transcriptional regulator n=2 Tax=Alteromonas halophila TaxID=516698 RepID=A0A918JJK5_9ALTE|nr:LysR family transcriptional regulator [Alteromonas halophila]